MISFVTKDLVFSVVTHHTMTLEASIHRNIASNSLWVLIIKHVYLIFILQCFIEQCEMLIAKINHIKQKHMFCGNRIASTASES